MQNDNMSCEFWVMRHAKTLWNAQGRIQGQSDSELTPEGLGAARLWGRGLRGLGLSLVVTSDLGRATATAQAVNEALGLPLYRDPGLREQHFGEWTGRVWNELKAESPDGLASLLALGWEFRPPGGESRSEMGARVKGALCGLAGKWPGQKVLVVCHEGPLKSLLYRLYGREFLPGEPDLLKPYRLHRLGCAGNELRVLELNREFAPAGAPGDGA